MQLILAIGRGGYAGYLFEGLVEIGCVIESALQRNAVDGIISGDQKLLRQVYPLGNDIVPGRKAVQLLE